MNVFDWNGPDFLIFYASLGGLCCVLISFWRRFAEYSPIPKIDLKDPYLIAYLSGGPSLCLQAVVMSLVDRGLMESRSNTVVTKKNQALDLALPEIERALLNYFSTVRSTKELETNDGLRRNAEAYGKKLRALRLLPDEKITRNRNRMLNALMGIFLIIGFIKLGIAMGRGRHNVFFLIIIGFIFSFGMVKLFDPRLTVLGKKVLSDFKDMFYTLYLKRKYLKTLGTSMDLAWLVALYGMDSVPLGVYPFAGHIFYEFKPMQQRVNYLSYIGNSGKRSSSDKSSRNSSNCSSCGSSGITSCGSSGGSSCGGGCGGGCGGCGS